MFKKLFWLEYGEATFFFKKPFESIGFQIHFDGWSSPGISSASRERIISDIKSWGPSVIFLAMGVAQDKQFAPVLADWPKIHHLVRQDSDLQSVRIIVLVNRRKLSLEETLAWEQVCDRLLYLPFQCVGYPQEALHLLGEEVGLAGVNNYLAHNGQWVTHDSTSLDTSQILPDAEGNFARPPLTRVLVAQSPSELSWLPSIIQVERPTNIVYLLKSQEEWRNGLHELEVSRLSTLARSVTCQHQLLVGVNDSLLQLEPEQATRVIKQIQQTGEWKVFATEHLWVEWMLPHHFFEDVAYNREHSKVKDTFVM